MASLFLRTPRLTPRPLARLAQLSTQIAPAAAKMSTKTDVNLYTEATPNGIKVSILLAELDLDYKLHHVNIFRDVQKEPWFLEINPNGRIPAITDKLDGKDIRVFESGAAMQYLVDRYDKDHKISYPYGSAEHWETTSWLMWQMGGQGPMQGQANHFKRYAPEHVEYGVNRYVNESRRLYRVLDTHLEKSASGFIVGDRLTIADIAIWGWASAAKWAGVNIDEFPAVKAWVYRLLERPGFEKGRHVPSEHKAFQWMDKTEEELTEMAASSRAWIQKGMKEEAEKK
jgi:glutathione S-transferase